MFVEEEISSQHSVQVIPWLLLSTFVQVYSEKQQIVEHKNMKFYEYELV